MSPVGRMRINIPDSSKLMMQSFSQSGFKPGSTPQQQQEPDNFAQNMRQNTLSQHCQQKMDALDLDKALQAFSTSLNTSDMAVLTDENKGVDLYSLCSHQRQQLEDIHNQQRQTDIADTRAQNVSNRNYLNICKNLEQQNAALFSSAQNAESNFSSYSPPSVAGAHHNLHTDSSPSAYNKIYNIESTIDPRLSVFSRDGILSRYLGGRQSSSISSQSTPVAEDCSPMSTGCVSSSALTSVQQSKSPVDCVDGPGTPGSSGSTKGGLLSRTRQFGAWLTSATGGDRMEVTGNDLNVLAPNSF